jgi:hypothetical protein
VSAQLTVVKTVKNTYNGSRVASDFVMQVTGTNVSNPQFNGSESGTVLTLDAGNYSVDESATLSDGSTPNDYTKTLGAGCSGTLLPGDAVVCTITNDDPVPAPTGTILVIKNVINDNAGESSPSSFTMHVTANNPLINDFPGSSEGIDVIVDVGDYAVDELSSGGYTKTLSEGCSGTIAVDETRTCIITNDDVPPAAATGTIHVVKNVINDNTGESSPSSFTMHVTATNPSINDFPGSSEGIDVIVDVGDYAVDELSSGGYTKTLSEECSGTIIAGESRTCTITNDDILIRGEGQTRLIVKTHVNNNDGGSRSAADFTSVVTGEDISAVSSSGTETGFTVDLNPGSFSVSQTALFGYSNSFSADCAGTIESGESKTCVITEDDPAVVTGGGGGGGGGGCGREGGGCGGIVPPPIVVVAPPSVPPPAPRVLGESFAVTLDGSCPLTETEAPFITSDPMNLLRNLGVDRDTSLERLFFRSLVPRVAPSSTDRNDLLTINTFTTYGTHLSLRLGAGERAGVVDSFRAIFGRIPLSACDWQMALRIANSQLPGIRNISRERSMEIVFQKIWKRDPDRTNTQDDLAIMMMSYGLRPQIRDLSAERLAIKVYQKVFGKSPHGATAWDTMRAIAYSGVPTP